MKFMDKFATVLEKYLMPVASAIGGQKHLCALRDGFISTLPVSMAGSFGTLFLNVLLKPDSLIGAKLNGIDAYATSVQPFLEKWVNPVFNQIWWGGLGMTSLFLLITISYSLAKGYDQDGLAAALVSVSAYFVLTPDAVGGLFALNDAGVYEGTGWGLMSWNTFNSSAMFATMITAFVATQLFITITKKGWTIKMPEQVPPAVSRAFSAVVPGFITLVVFGIIFVIFKNVGEIAFKDAVSKAIQEPLVKLGQSPITYIFLILLSQLLWFFGLHGLNMVEPALNAMYGPALNENLELVQQGLEPVNALTRNFVDVYAMPGGSGGTLALLIAVFIFSKRQETRELAKLAVGPGIFQINEPVIFGLPIVLNVSYFIPFLLIPPICLTLAWVFTEVIPFADYLQVGAPWVTPPVLSAFLGTNGDWKAAVLAAGLLILSIVLWSPFVIAANKMGDVQE